MKVVTDSDWVHPDVAKEDALGFDMVHRFECEGGWRWVGDGTRPIRINIAIVRSDAKSDEFPDHFPGRIKLGVFDLTLLSVESPDMAIYKRTNA